MVIDHMRSCDMAPGALQTAFTRRGGEEDLRAETVAEGKRCRLCDDVASSDVDKILQTKDIRCQLNWTWDETDCSSESIVSDENDNLSVTFHPNWSNGTAGIRGGQPLVAGYNYWEVTVGSRLFGTSLMFGVSDRSARLHADEFLNLLGEDSHSWALSHRGRVFHNGESRYYCKPFQDYTPVVIGVLLDKDNGQISFFKDGQNLGVAFADLGKIEADLYATVCSTAAKSNMTLGRRRRSFFSLQDRCSNVIATAVDCNQSKSDLVHSLPLPGMMKKFILTY